MDTEKHTQSDGLFNYIDRNLALNYCMNDEEVLKEVLLSYVGDDRRRILQKSLITENWHDYQVNVHAVKSNSLTIGAADLSAKAKALEAAAKELDGQFITDNHGEMISEYSELIELIKEYLGI